MDKSKAMQLSLKSFVSVQMPLGLPAAPLMGYSLKAGSVFYFPVTRACLSGPLTVAKWMQCLRPAKKS